MDRLLLFVGATSAAMAVLVGGARAHLLAKRLAPFQLTMLEVGMRYQLAHATGIILAAIMLAHLDSSLPRVAGWGFVLGTLLFPIVLYTYALTGKKIILKISPIGGAVLLASWLTLALGALA